MKTNTGAFKHLWLSPWTRWVGFRYLMSKKNSRFLSFITILSMMGVALGVSAMIVVMSVMDGFESELKKRLMTSDLHILVSPSPEVPGFDRGFVSKTSVPDSLVESVRAENPQIEGFWPLVSTEVILKVGRKVTGVVFKGVTKERMDKLRTQVTEAAEPTFLVDRVNGEEIRLPRILIGQELANQLGVIPGDRVTLISPTETEGPMDAVPRLKRYAVEGVYSSGLPEQELHTIYATDTVVRSFLRRADAVSQWELTVSDFETASVIAEKLAPKLPGFKVQDWIQLNSHLFASLKLERVAMFVILAFIVVVASFNIVTTLTLMVLEKKKEISILKAMGARSSQIAAVFLAEGAFIGAIGVGGGAVLGFILCSVLKRYDIIQLPDVYYDRSLPVTFEPMYYLLISVSALVIVLYACLYPSRRAARLNPLDGIRFG